jgi:drug/metabolite transporter (DMT)-like permease
MLLVVVFWAVNFSFVKIALHEFSPMGFNGFRLILASLVLSGILIASREGFSIARADLWKLILLGICGNTVFQIFFIRGIDLTTASNTSIIMAMGPIFIALLSVTFKHERIHLAAWAGILVSFFGFYMVISGRSGAMQISWQTMSGDLMVFSGTLFWGIYTVFARPLLKKMSPLKLTTVTMVFGTIFFLPFSLKDMVQTPFQGISWHAWTILVYSGLFALVIGYVVWYISVQRVGNSKTAIYGNLVPIFAVMFAYFTLEERITAIQAGGALIIFVGVYLTRSGYRFFRQKNRV